MPSLATIAQLISPTNPTPLTPSQLAGLTVHLSLRDLRSLIELIAVDDLAHAPPTLAAIAAKDISVTHSFNKDAIDALASKLDLAVLDDNLDSSVTPPHSSPLLPSTPTRQVYIKSAPSTPARPPDTRGALYKVTSPSNTEYPTNCSCEPGRSWAEVQRVIKGPHAYQCGFPSLATAEKAWAYARSRGWTGDAPVPNIPQPLPSSYQPNALNSTDGKAPANCLECHLNISGVRAATYQSFTTLQEAEAAFAEQAVKGNIESRRPGAVMYPLQKSQSLQFAPRPPLDKHKISRQTTQWMYLPTLKFESAEPRTADRHDELVT
ncbi:hypothetical protein C8R43DRAFT_963139 [Mycena crocata]|nr:hypothetical protein C8R43DRAFT_963139 [Mycena crocata]